MHTIGTQGQSSGPIYRRSQQTLGLSAVRRPEAVFGYNRQYIDDLPATSPHGSDSDTLRELLALYRFERRAWHSNATPREDGRILQSFVRSFAERIGRRNTKPESTRRSFKD